MRGRRYAWARENREAPTHATPTPDDKPSEDARPDAGPSASATDDARSEAQGTSDLGPGVLSGSAPEAAGDPVRITSIVGTLASLAIVVAFFLPWLHVEPEQARRYRERMETRFDDPVQRVPEGVSKRDWLRLAGLAADQGHVSGLDVFYWARIAGRTTDAYARSDGISPEAGSSTLTRGIRMAAVILAALPVLAFFIAVVFVVGRFRRAHSPILVLAVLGGATAIAVPAAYAILESGLRVRSEPALGLHVLGVAGPLLLLTGVFGVRLKNWWRVFMGAVIVGGTLALVGWAWLERGSAP